MNKEKQEKVLERVKGNTYRMALQVFGIFAGAGIAGALLGKLFDNQFDTGPFGVLGMLSIFYIAAWVGVIKINKEMTAEIKRANKEEENKSKKKEKKKK